VEQYKNFSVNDIHSMARFNCLDMILSRSTSNEYTKCYVKYQNDPGKTLKTPEVELVVEDLYVSMYEDLEQNGNQLSHQDDIVNGMNVAQDGEEKLGEDGHRPPAGSSIDAANTVLRPWKDILVFVLYSEPNAALINRLKSLYDKDGVFIVAINIQRLQFNIQNHSLVPSHVILSEEELQKEVVDAFGLENSSTKTLVATLPEISRFDPVAMCILMKPGQVCRIHRKSDTAVNSLYYRVCV
jgi:DNA-directed RNA polymerase subunit H